MATWKKVVVSGSIAQLANETFISGHITASGIVKAEHLFSTDDAQITDDLVVGGNIDLEGDIDVNGTANLDAVDIDGAVNVAAALTMATTNKIQFRDTAIYINSDADGHLEAVADTGISFKIGSTEQIILTDGLLAPTTTNDVDLGSAAKKFKNLFLTGDVTASGHAHVVGDITSSAIIKAEHFHSTDDAEITDNLTVGGDIDLEGSIDVNGTANLDVVDIDGAVNMATTALVTGVLTTTAIQVVNGGLALATNKKIQFRDSAIFINSDADGHLELVADTGISLKIGSTEQIILTDGVLRPTTANDIDLGTKALPYKDGFFRGSVSSSILIADDIVSSSAGYFSGDVLIDGTLTAGTFSPTSILNTSLVIGRDSTDQIKFSTNDQIIFRVGNADNVIFKASGEIEATSLDISGNADIAGDLTGLDNITSTNYVVGGHTIDDIDITSEFVDADAHIMSSKAIGARFAVKNADTTGTATNATNAAHVLITDNESTDEHNQLTFIEGAGGGGANRGLEADGHLTYNPSKGLVIAPNFSASGHIHAVGDITSSAIIKAEHLHSTDDAQVDDNLTVGGDIDLEGSIDVNGTANLDVVDIDGAVNMATTALVTGVLTTTAIQVVNGGLALATNKKVQFRDSAIYINSDADGFLELVADTGISFKIGSTEQFILKDGAISPTTTNDVDLGTATHKFKNLFLTGDVTASGHAHVVGDITSSATVRAEHLHSTDDASIADDLTVGGDADITGTLTAGTFAPTSILNTSLVVGRDSTDQIKFSTNDQIIFRVGNADNVIFKASGEIEATSLDISGNADIAGDLTGLDNVTSTNYIIGGHTIDDIDITSEFVDADAHIMSSKAIGARFAQKNADTTGTATNATNAAHVLITDNESTDEHNQITFIEGAGGGGANRGLEADGHLTYNPSKGLVIAPNFSASGHIHAAGDITSSAIISAEHLFSSDDAEITDNLTVGGDIDLEGSIDVNGTANLDVVDIDGAVNMATTALVTGVLTTTAIQVVNGGLALATNKKVQFRDSAIYINSDADGSLESVADTSITFKIGSTEQLSITDGVLAPTTTNDVDLGSATKKFKNLFLTGDITASGHAHVVGDITASGVLKGATGNIAGALVAATLDTGQGANELYDMDQNVKTTNAVTFTTVNTGQGANELYGMDQAVKTNSNVTFADLQVDGDLVVAGTASFTNTTNLEIKDRFISLASGSTSVGDGGIVVNHFGGTYPSGSAFGYEGGTANRWAVQNEFAPTGSTFAPDAYMGIVTFSTSAPSGNPTYGGANYGYGNIHVETDTGDIFIFA